MSRSDVRSVLGTLSASMGAASAQWRLMIVWLVGLLIPTTIAAMPLRSALFRLDWSPHATELARHFDFVIMSDIANDLVRHTGATLLGALLLAVTASYLLAPLLTGATLAAARRPNEPLGFATLLASAIGDYGRLMWLQVLSLVSLGVAAGIGAVVIDVADKRGEHAVLASQATASWRGAIFVTVVVYALAHAALEAARARLAVEPTRPVWRAWADGMRMLIERPLTVLALYLVPTLLGGLAMSLVMSTRVRLAGATMLGFVVAWMVTQLGMAAIGWGRAARLIGLTALAAERGSDA